MKARQVGWSILFFLLSMLLLTGCGGSSGNDASDDVSDDDDDNDDNDDNDNDDNDDNDDDTTDDFPIQLVDGGAPGHNGVSMVRSADGTFHLAAVRGYSLIVYSWQDKDIAEEKVFTPAAEPILRQDADGYLCVVFLDPFEHVLRYADNRTGKWVTAAIQEHISDLETYSFALDASGKACVAYYDSTSGKILYATNRSGSWVSTAVGDAAPAPSGTAIGVDAAGAVHVAYDGSPAGSLYYATNASGSWATELVTANGYAPAMVLDSAGRPRLIYRVPVEWCGSRLDYAVRDAGEWQMETADAPNGWNFYHYDLTLDSQEKAHISAHVLEGNGPGVYGKLYYLTNQGDQWTEEEIDLHIYSFYGQFTAMAVDEEDRPYIGYYSFEDEILKVASNVSDSWKYRSIDQSGWAGNDMLVVNTAGQAFIGYRFNGMALNAAKNVSGSWTSEMVDDLLGQSYSHAIAVDSFGYIHLAYSGSFDNTLQYADNVAGFWNIQTVEPESGEYFRIQSLVVDAQGHAHLSYNGEGDLRYATNLSGVWDIQTVVTAGSVANYGSAIALDGEGHVQIAFIDGIPGECWGFIFYVTNQSGDWMIETINVTDQARGLARTLLLDSGGHAHLAYVTNSDPYEIKYATNETGTWITTVISSGSISDQNIAIGLDSDEKISIAYYTYGTNPGGFFLADNSTGDWVTQRLSGWENVSEQDVSLAIDATGLVHAAYGYQGGLFYRVFDPSR